jgi:Ser/Thr protein kinase RdoA (MazF antagonist)
MKSFERLSRLGKLRREHVIALQALARYDLKIDRVRLISSSTNLIYRIIAGKRPYILRLAFPDWRSPEAAGAEAVWLAALARDTDIPVPQIIPASDGNPVVRIGPRHALLMTCLPGMSLSRRLTEENIRKMGELFGKLHEHAAAWTPPPAFPSRRFDRYLSRGEPEALLSEDRLSELEPGDAETIREMGERVNAGYANLDPADVRVIHCDLWHDNIKLHRGVLAPFDFEDVILGYRLHDIAMAMLDLAEEVGVEAYYDHLLPAFKAGYRARLPWPDGDLELLQMGRLLWKLNWIAARAPAQFPSSARRHAGMFLTYRETGRLFIAN